MRVEEAFAAAGLNIAGKPIPARRIIVTCPDCQRDATADAMETAESGQQTNHLCPNCGAVALTVSPAPGVGGYRLGEWVVRPLAGMAVDVPGKGKPV